MQGNILGQSSSGELNIDGIIQEYLVASDEFVKAGDFVEYVNTISTKITQSSTYRADNSKILNAIAISDNKVLILRDYNGSLYGTICVINEENGTISIEYNNSISEQKYPTSFSVVQLSEDTIFVTCAFSSTGASNGTPYLYGTIYKISNMGITKVTSLQLNSEYCSGKSNTVKLSNNKVFITIPIIDSSYGNHVDGFLCTINNDNSEITLNSMIEICKGTGVYAVSATIISENKVFVAYSRDTRYMLHARICTIDGNTVALNTETVLDFGENTGRNIYTLNLTNNLIFIMHIYSFMNNLRPEYKLCTIDSSNNITVKSTGTLDNNGIMSDTNSSCESIVKLSNNEIICFYRNSSLNVYAQKCLIANNKVYVCYSKTQIDSNTYSGMCAVKVPKNRAFIFAIADNSDNTYCMNYIDTGGVKKLKHTEKLSEYGASVGIAKKSGFNGETIEVTIPSSIENEVPIGQAQGQSITLTDSVRYPFKELKIIGNTIQEQSEEGNNKFYIEGAFKYGDGTDRTTVNNDGTITTTSNFAESRNKGTLIQGLKKNTTYTVSLQGISIESSSGPTHAEIEILKANAGIIKQETFWGANNTVIGKRVKVPFNTGDNTEVSIHISGFYTAGQTGQFVYKNVMLVEGTDIEYEPYVKDTPSPKYPSEIKSCNSINIKISNATEQQNLEFPLSQGQVLRKGDYLADDGIHHVRKQLILEGTENWEYDNNCVKMLKSDIKGVNDIKSTHFKACTQLEVQEGTIKNGIAVGEEGNNGIIIRKDGIESGEQFNTWLQQENNNETPVIIEYESKEETIENYTEEQQTAYEKLKKLYSYEGTTIIECIDEVSSEFEVTYVKQY